MNIYIPTENDIIHETSVDFVLRPCAKEIYIVQYDKSLPIIKVELYRNGERYVLPETGAVVNVRLGKLDKTFVYKSILGTNSERNAVYFEIDEQMATIPGHVGPVIEVIEGSKVACSSPIHMIIEKNPVQNDQIESHDSFPIIYELQGTVADHEARITDLESKVTGEVVTLHTDQDNIDGRKTFQNSVTIENNLSSTDKYLGSLRFTGDTLQEENAPIITVHGSDGLMTFLKISDDGDLQGDGLDLHSVAHIYGLHLPERNNEAVNKEYADRKLELHPFNGFVGGSQVHEQIQNGQIKYCQSGTQTDIDPSQAPIINIELTQEHISSVSNKKAVYIKKIHIEYELDSEIGVNKTWEYEFTSRIFGSGSASDDINPKVVSLSDMATGLALEWTLIYRPATGKQYYGSYNATKGQQFGSNTHPSDYISLYTTSIQNATIKNVWIEVSGNSGTTAKIKLTLVQDQWTVNDVVDPNITANNEQYIFYHENGTHLGSGSGEIIEYNHVFLKKENDIVTSISAKSEYLYIEEDPSKESDTYRLYKYVDDQMQEVSKTRLGTTSDTAYRGDYGQDNYNKLKQVREQEFTFYGEKTFGNGLNIQNSVDHDSYNISTSKISQEYNVDELQIQKKGNTYSILSIIAPTQDPKESTLALKVENSGINSNETYFMDISVMNYMNTDEDPEESIYIQSRNASVKPNFNIGYTDETQTRHKKFIVTHDALPIMLKNTGIWIKNTNDKSIHSWADRTELSLAEIQSIKTIGNVTTRVTNLENNVVYKGDATESLRLYTFGKFEGATYNSLQVAIAYTDWHNYALIPNIKCLNESVVRLEPTGVNQNYDSGVYQIYGHMPLSAAEGHRYSLEYCFNISNTPNATYIPQYNEAGRLKSNDPYFDDDVVNKRYVNNYLNIQNGIGTNAIQEKMTDATVNFAGRNPNAEALDPTISTVINTGASGNQSSAFGKNTMALATASFTNGNKTLAKGEESHAEGYQSVTLGDGSHAEGARTTAVGLQSHSEGADTIAKGEASHSEGHNTIADNYYAHAEGEDTIASGHASHAEGEASKATALSSHAEGTNNYIGEKPQDGPSGGDETTPSQPSGYNFAAGESAHVEGFDNFVYGAGSHAEGCQNVINGTMSHAEGVKNTIGNTDGAHAEGYQTTVTGIYAHAEGYKTQAIGEHAHAEGNDTKAQGDNSHAEGQYTITVGTGSHAEGQGTETQGSASHAEGNHTKAQGDNSHSEGYETQAQGDNSHAEGQYTKAIGVASHSEGDNTQAIGHKSHAEGYQTKSSGLLSHAEGNQSQAKGSCSHAEGNNTIAEGEYSHAEGQNTHANGYASHAQGASTYAKGTCSFAGGQNTEANANFATVIGLGLYTNVESSFVVGKYNATTADVLFGVGNGTADNDRSNALEVYSDGHAEIQLMGSTNKSVVTKEYADTKYTKPSTGIPASDLQEKYIRTEIDSQTVYIGDIDFKIQYPSTGHGDDTKLRLTINGLERITFTDTYGNLDDSMSNSMGLGWDADGEKGGYIRLNYIKNNTRYDRYYCFEPGYEPEYGAKTVQYLLSNETVGKWQRTTSVVAGPLTNINGRTFQNYTATLKTSGYTYYHIQCNAGECSEEEASIYMYYMTGSKFVPKYDYNYPKNSIIIFADGSMWKPQYDSSAAEKFCLFRLQDSYANTFVLRNTAITGATKCKITYDSKGLVTAGADLAASDIPNLDASKITSGTFDAARLPAAKGHHVYIELSASSTDRSDQYIYIIWITSDGKYHYYNWHQVVGTYFEAEDVIAISMDSSNSTISSYHGTNIIDGRSDGCAILSGYRKRNGSEVIVSNHISQYAYQAIDGMIHQISQARDDNNQSSSWVAQIYSDIELTFEWED